MNVKGGIPGPQLDIGNGYKRTWTALEAPCTMANVPTLKDIGQAIVLARKEARLTQTDLADAIGAKQPTISALETGARKDGPTVLEMMAIERACQRPPGFILRRAGYMHEVVGVAAAAALDSDLDDGMRHVVQATYRAAVEASEFRRLTDEAFALAASDGDVDAAQVSRRTATSTRSGKTPARSVKKQP